MFSNRLRGLFEDISVLRVFKIFWFSGVEFGILFSGFCELVSLESFMLDNNGL